MAQGRTLMAQAGLGLRNPVRTRPASVRRAGWALGLAAAVFGIALAAYVADVATHRLGLTLDWFDLNIYNHAGLITRHAPARLYTWQFRPGVRYLYTPFAAMGFAAGSLLPWAVLKWLMTVASLAAMVATVWVTFGQLGWHGQRRGAAVLAVSAVALWTEPVLRSVHVGLIELVLMALIAWDICQPEHRRGKLRQAGVATGVFAVTVVIGFAVLPGESVKWWLTGYFLHAGNFTNQSLGSLLNQSVLALLTRTPDGAGSVTALWLAAAVVIACLGLAAAALLARAGRPTAGWVTCAVTGVLVSPISWDNHWVWIVPVLALLADAAVRARGTARAAYLALGVALFAVFADWPTRWTGPRAFVPHGLVGFNTRKHPMSEIFHLNGAQLIGWNLYVLGGLLIFTGLLAAATAAWRNQARDGYLMRRPISSVP